MKDKSKLLPSKLTVAEIKEIKKILVPKRRRRRKGKSLGGSNSNMAYPEKTSYGYTIPESKISDPFDSNFSIGRSLLLLKSLQPSENDREFNRGTTNKLRELEDNYTDLRVKGIKVFQNIDNRLSNIEDSGKNKFVNEEDLYNNYKSPSYFLEENPYKSSNEDFGVSQNDLSQSPLKEGEMNEDFSSISSNKKYIKMAKKQRDKVDSAINAYKSAGGNNQKILTSTYLREIKSATNALKK